MPESVGCLINKHYNEQCSYRQIARIVNRPKSTVADNVMRYQNTPEISSGRTGRCGRPRLLTQRDERTVRRASTSTPQATTHEIQTVVQGSAASVSVATKKRTF